MLMRGCALGALFLLGLALHAQRGMMPPAPAGRSSQTGQQALDPRDLCTVEGRVHHAFTGEPLPRVTVSLQPTAPGAGRGGTPAAASAASSRIVRTDAEGRFRFEAVPPGTYRLVAERVGFLRQAYGARTLGGSGAPINLTPGQTVRNLDIQLTPQGVITGKVLDDEGDPVPRIPVMAFRLSKSRDSSARRQVSASSAQQSASATTNDIGEFRLAGLPPGSYLVVARPTARYGRGPDELAGRRMFAPERGRTAAPTEELLPTYYPSSPDPDSALPVQVSAGQETGGITIHLYRGRLFSVEGRVIGAPENQPVGISLFPKGNAALIMGNLSATARSDGSFTIAGVPPGSYYLVAETGARGPARGGPNLNSLGRAVGYTSVDVKSSDVRGLVISLSDPLTVTGSIRVAGHQPLEFQAATVTLIPQEWIPGFGSTIQARVSQGTFQLNSVLPDLYYLEVRGLPSGSYVQSVRLNNQEVLDKGIDLTNSRGSVTLDVLINPEGASVEGTVVGDGQPLAGVTVALRPDPPKPAQPYLSRTVITDQNGSFAFRGLPPGTYRLLALLDPDPEFLTEQLPQVISKGTAVRLAQGSQEKIELSVYKPEDLAR